MSGLPSRLILALVLVAGAFGVPAAAAPCRLCDTPEVDSFATDENAPLGLEVESELDFDRLVLTGAGDAEAILGADGQQRTSGAVEPLSGRVMVGRVRIRGEANRPVVVDLPDSVELTSARGGTVRIDSLVTDLPRDPRLDSDGTLVVNFGGALRVTGDIDGDFRGNITIRVDYL